MAISYVEEAILRVKDQSSKPIRKINEELKKLFATARRPVKIEFRGLDRAARQIKDVKLLGVELSKLARRKGISIDVNAPGAKAAANDVARLNRELAQLVNLRKQHVSITGG
ncbi:MAG: hypothetical protein ACRCYS_01190, partial [Beijerinckiaceae bacterium]